LRTQIGTQRSIANRGAPPVGSSLSRWFAALGAAVLMVMVAVAPLVPGVTVAGANDTVAPGGSPLAVSATGSTNVPVEESTSTL